MKFDVIILGAGINGSAIANRLSDQGKSVLVLDKSHIGAGASSHSSKLIHGGLRYLENAEFGMVFESLHERTRLLEKYPDIIHLKPFLFPVYKGAPKPAWMIRIGLFFYDLLSSFKAPFQSITIDAVKKRYPGLNTKGLKAAFIYYDAQTDDLKLTQTIAQEAVGKGAKIIEFCQIQSIACRDGRYLIKSSAGDFESKRLVNATGAWIDEVNSRFSLPAAYHISKVSGIHIVINRLIVDEPVLLFARDKRIFFLLPQSDKGVTIIGTTEREERGESDAITINDADIAYLVDESNCYLNTPITKSDIIDTYIGVRPLVASNRSIHAQSREYQLDKEQLDGSTLLHIFGGKLTTHDALAKKAVKKLFQ